MGKCRFLCNNLITSGNSVSITDVKAGIVTAAYKEGSGSGILNTFGNFSGSSIDTEYTIEIDDITTVGADVGEATFKWGTATSAWIATGVTTTSSVSVLDDSGGVSISFTAGSGDDFALADKFYFKGLNYFGSSKLVDWNRDTQYRSDGTSITILVNLASAQGVSAVCMYDHNLSSGASITFSGCTVDSWDDPRTNETIVYKADKILHYLSTVTTLQYWRLAIDDGSNPDGYIYIGELYLGPYSEPVGLKGKNPKRDTNTLLSSKSNKYGKQHIRYLNEKKQLNYSFPFTTDADADNFENILSSIENKSTGILQPLLFNEDSSSTTDTWMVYLTGIGRTPKHKEYTDVAIKMEEAVKSL